MEAPETNIRRMIQELNQYILPSTLMESFDAYRAEAYKEAIRSIAPSTLAWFLDMLNRYRGPEGRMESLLEVFDSSMFTVNHPAWETPPGTAIDLPALTSDIAARAEGASDIAEVARSEARQFREHADTYDDAELMELGRSRSPDSRILVEPFAIGKMSSGTLRSMQVRRWRTCGLRTSAYRRQILQGSAFMTGPRSFLILKNSR